MKNLNESKYPFFQALVLVAAGALIGCGGWEPVLPVEKTTKASTSPTVWSYKSWTQYGPPGICPDCRRVAVKLDSTVGTMQVAFDIITAEDVDICNVTAQVTQDGSTLFDGTVYEGAYDAGTTGLFVVLETNVNGNAHGGTLTIQAEAQLAAPGDCL